MTALARLAAMRCPLDWRIGAYAAICGVPCEPIDAHTRLQYLAGYIAGQQMAALDYYLEARP